MSQAPDNRLKKLLVPASLAITILAIALAAGVTVRQQSWMIADRRTVIASYELSVQVDRIFILLQDAESAQQAYLLSGLPERREYFEKTVSQFDEIFAKLNLTFRDDALVGGQIRSIEQDVNQEVAQLRALMNARDKRYLSDSRSTLTPYNLITRDKEAIARIRAKTMGIKEDQRFFRVVRSAELLSETERSQGQLNALIALALLAVAGCSLFALRQLRVKDEALALAHASAVEIAATQDKLSLILASMDEGLIMLNRESKIDYVNLAGESLLGYEPGQLVGQNVHRTIHHTLPDGSHRPEESCPLVNVIKSGVTYANEEDYFVRKDNSFFPVHYVSSPLMADGIVTGAVLAFYDISDRQRDAIRLKAQYDISTILATGADLSGTVQEIIKLICERFDWQFGALWLVEDDTLRSYSQLAASPGSFAEFSKVTSTVTFEIGKGLPGRVFADRRPIWIADVVKDSNFHRGPAAAASNLHGAFAVPILSGNEQIGVLEFFCHAVRTPDAAQLEMFNSICAQVGQFIQRIRSIERVAFSEGRYSLGLEGSQDGIWDWNIDTNEVFLSDRWKAILGYAPNEFDVDLDSFMDIMYPDDRQGVIDALEDHIAGKTAAYTASYRAPDKNGNLIWIANRGKGLRDASGRMYRMSGSSRDVTQDREAAERLKQSERKFKAIFDKTFEFIGLMSAEGYLIDVNESVLKFTQRTREEVVGQPFWEGPWFMPEDIPRIRQAIVDAAAGKFARFEMDHVNDDGLRIVVDFSLQPVFDDDGQVVMIIPEGRDITQLKLTEAKLTESEALFRQLAENIREIFWIATPDSSKFFYVSPAYEDITGRSIETIAADPHSFFDVLEPEDRRKAFSDFHEFVRASDGQEGEYRVIRPDGEVRWLAAKVFPINNEKGELVRVCGVARDINDRKEAERRVSEFYSTVSHELRSPLTSIRGSLGLIENGIVGDVSPQALTFVTIARTESDRLIRLINNILDLRKIEAGKLELILSEVAIDELVQANIVAMQGFATEAQVELIAPTVEHRVIVVDRDLVSQVLTNLLSNAIKFSPGQGKVSLKVSAIADDSPMRFEVKDEGPGIPPSQVHKLFGKFQQLDSSDTRSKGGTGLGLAIAKAIVEQHHGHMGVESVEGQGSTFWFDLPVNLAIDAEASNEEASAIQQNAKGDSTGENLDGLVSSDGQSHSVLIIEDDPATIAVLRQQIGAMNLNCFVAKDGEQGLALVRQHCPDLVILDLGLPKMDGFEFVESLRADKIDLPLLVYTARDLSSEDKEALHMSLTRFLIKSQNSVDDLIAAVNELVQQLVSK